MKELLRENEVSDRLSIPVKTLQRWRYVGGGPEFVKLGHAVRYPTESLIAWVEARRCASTAEFDRG